MTSEQLAVSELLDMAKALAAQSEKSLRQEIEDLERELAQADATIERLRNVQFDKGGSR